MNSPSSWLMYCLLVVFGLVSGCSTWVQKNTELPELPTASDMKEPERRARLRLDLASAYFENGQSEIALNEIKIALDIYASFADAYNLRALIYASIGMNDLAEKNFKRAIQFNPNNGQFWHNYAWFYCQTGQTEDSKRLFERTLTLVKSVELPKTWLAYGICQGRAKNWRQSESLLMQAYQLEPHNVLIKLNLAEAMYQLQEYQSSFKLIKEISDDSSVKDASFLWLNWRIQTKIGNNDAARKIEEELLRRFPKSHESTLLNLGKF